MKLTIKEFNRNFDKEAWERYDKMLQEHQRNQMIKDCILTSACAAVISACFYLAFQLL